MRRCIVEGAGALAEDDCEVVSFSALPEPGLTVLRVTATQSEHQYSADATITVVELIGDRLHEDPSGGCGIPDYTFLHAPDELWRSRYDAERNLIVVNNGHGDYIHTDQKRARKLRYILRLYAKDLVLSNFPGFESHLLLERMIELSLYTEDHLR